MIPRYDFSISGEAARFLFGRARGIRRKAEDVFDHLGRHPSTAGDFQETAPSGRVYHVKIFEDLIVTYWVDHAVREIRIVRCEIVDEDAR